MDNYISVIRGKSDTILTMQNSQINFLLKKNISKILRYLSLYFSLITISIYSDQEVEGLETEGDAIHIWLNYDNKEDIISRYKKNKPIQIVN